jgi:hypothetical protein
VSERSTATTSSIPRYFSAVAYLIAGAERIDDDPRAHLDPPHLSTSEGDDAGEFVAE